MNSERIVELWRMGHTREWLVQKQAEDIAYLDRVKGLKKPQIKLVAQKDIEEALLDWWRKQINGKDISNRQFKTNSFN